MKDLKDQKIEKMEEIVAYAKKHLDYVAKNSSTFERLESELSALDNQIKDIQKTEVEYSHICDSCERFFIDAEPYIGIKVKILCDKCK